MQQPSPRGSGLGTLLLAFVAGAIGGAAGALVVMPHGAAVGGTDDAGLRQSLHSLDETVRALGVQVAALSRNNPLPAAHPTEPIPEPAGSDVGSILARLDEIAKLLQLRTAGATTGFTGTAPLPVLQAPAAPTDPSALAALAALATEDNEHREVWRRHAFWTCQQVLDAYGLPDQIDTSDGNMDWYYETAGRTVHFAFSGGLLVNVWN